MNIQQKNKCINIYKKDKELKVDNIEKKSMVNYGNDSINCNIFHDRDST